MTDDPKTIPAAETLAPAPGMKWYVVHTYSGFEEKVRQSIERKKLDHSMEAMIGRVLVPSENVLELHQGKRRVTNRKFFPGYILVEMVMDNETWHFIRNVPKVTGFVGGMNEPIAVPEEEVVRLIQQMAADEDKPKPKMIFREGEVVRVIDGPFTNFTGVVESTNPERGKVKVLVSIFGRYTPVELDYVQIEKG
jgi:transcriptional antiterminator NusG